MKTYSPGRRGRAEPRRRLRPAAPDGPDGTTTPKRWIPRLRTNDPRHLGTTAEGLALVCRCAFDAVGGRADEFFLHREPTGLRDRCVPCCAGGQADRTAVPTPVRGTAALPSGRSGTGTGHGPSAPSSGATAWHNTPPNSTRHRAALPASPVHRSPRTAALRLARHPRTPSQPRSRSSSASQCRPRSRSSRLRKSRSDLHPVRRKAGIVDLHIVDAFGDGPAPESGPVIVGRSWPEPAFRWPGSAGPRDDCFGGPALPREHSLGPVAGAARTSSARDTRTARTTGRRPLMKRPHFGCSSRLRTTTGGFAGQDHPVWLPGRVHAELLHQ
ncbi:hypothetical protein GA0115254_126840 [Streptomyces sp. Ncost-T10-10d]|nr:hypothetical protein GA0115254_126840 [Streptomyces sp. Ncost-T10-10d]